MSHRRRWKRTEFPGILGVLLIAGCGTVRLEVPPGYDDVRLLEVDEPAEVRVERTVWFWMWGGNPISDNTTKTEIEQYNLKEVRLRTEQTLLDTIITPITAVVSIVRRTLIVEGNTDRAVRRNPGNTR
jgi:hypothetical protein